MIACSELALDGDCRVMMTIVTLYPTCHVRMVSKLVSRESVTSGERGESNKRELDEPRARIHERTCLVRMLFD